MCNLQFPAPKIELKCKKVKVSKQQSSDLLQLRVLDQHYWSKEDFESKVSITTLNMVDSIQQDSSVKFASRIAFCIVLCNSF